MLGFSLSSIKPTAFRRVLSSYPSTGPVEERKPSFWRRPTPMWAFILLVVIIILILFIPAFFTGPPPTIQQPLVVTPRNQLLFINQTQLTANFTVANLNFTNTISAVATATLLPANPNVTLTMSGVQTSSSFVSSSDGKTVSFPPGASTLVVGIVPKNNMRPVTYLVQVSLAD